MKVEFETHPSKYRHFSLETKGHVAKLTFKAHETRGLSDGYKLKLNSYDLSVDIELADAIERIRFEHPNVSVVTIESGLEKVFSAGANIFMLQQSNHGFKVNFCKFTNETRVNMEDASEFSGIRFLCAANGITAGGGYELALACDKIILVDDNNSAVSLPEIPLLGVLPGTGGLTRLVDKRKVRKDLADAFCTVAEGVKGKKALEWGLVDKVVVPLEFSEAVRSCEQEMVGGRSGAKGIQLAPLHPQHGTNEILYKHVQLRIIPDQRMAEMTVFAPTSEQPKTAEEMVQFSADLWSLQAFREMNDALMQLRFNHPAVALVTLKTKGDDRHLLNFETALCEELKKTKPHWFAIEMLSLMRRVLKKFDVTSKSFVALIEDGSCFSGSLAEFLFIADQSFLSLPNPNLKIRLSELNFTRLPMSNGNSRLLQRFSGNHSQFADVREIAKTQLLDASLCVKMGLVTHALDEIDYEDEVRIFCEERASLSPDALTGMEASLRFGGPETMESKIFGRLSAWQNWIFTRSNATGEHGALTSYGKPTRPNFDFTRC